MSWQALIWLSMALAAASLAVALWSSSTSDRKRVLARLRKQEAEVELKLAWVDERLEELFRSHRKLRAKLYQRARRDEPAPDSELPDPRTDPDGWKRAMRARLHAGQISGGKNS